MFTNKLLNLHAETEATLSFICTSEDPLEEGMATHSSILAWRINPMDRGAWRVTVHGVTKSQTQLDTTEQLTLRNRA